VVHIWGKIHLRFRARTVQSKSNPKWPAPLPSQHAVWVYARLFATWRISLPAAAGLSVERIGILKGISPATIWERHYPRLDQRWEPD
jgi:hypothetical protein